MKKGFLALWLLSALSVFGQQQSNPDDMNLSFDTDIVFLSEPKYTLSLGARVLSGVKSDFSGSGQVVSEQRFGDPTGPEFRRYHDGAVGIDQRKIPIDDGNGGTVLVPITSDGLTNNWSFTDSRQVQPDGTIAMHAYTADIANGGRRENDPKSSYGMELSVNRDVGRLTKHINWSLVGGLSLNGISSRVNSAESATITTVTDAYSLAGASAPAAPYFSNQTTSENVFDSNGNPVLNADGTPSTRSVNNTVLLADQPQTRTTTVATNTTSVTNHFKLKGAFFTLRAGPTFVIPITQRLKATVSFGAAAVIAGTDYEVEEDFVADTSAEIDDTLTNREAKLLPGYYADANLEYTLTERAGFYAGGVYQSTGSYTQKIESPSANYQTTIDLSSLSGFHFGMNVRF